MANEDATQVTDNAEKYKYLYLIEECWKETHDLKKASELIGIGFQVVKNYKPLFEAFDKIVDPWYCWGAMFEYHIGNLVREDAHVEKSQEKLKRFVEENKENVPNLQELLDAAIKAGRDKLEEFSKNL